MVNKYISYTKKYERFLIILEAVGNAHMPISHAHIHGRLLTYYWHIFKTSYIPRIPINRKREKNQNVTAFLRCRSQRPYERRRKGTKNF
jgi:hypothetical protein